MRLDGYQCQGKDCGSRVRLQVHHKTYVRFGNERMGDLVTLCESCHAKEHERLNLIKQMYK